MEKVLEKVKNGEPDKCFVCNTELESKDSKRGCKFVKAFGLRNILQVEPEILKGTATEDWNRLKLCGWCWEDAEKGKEMYDLISKLIEQFRNIQKRWVKKLRTNHDDRESERGGGRRNQRHLGADEFGSKVDKFVRNCK